MSNVVEQAEKPQSPSTDIQSIVSPLSSSSSSSSSSSLSSVYSEPFEKSLYVQVFQNDLKFVDDPFEDNPNLFLSPDNLLRNGERLLRPTTLDQNSVAVSEDGKPDDATLPIFPTEPSFDDIFGTPVHLSLDKESRRHGAVRLLSLNPGKADPESIVPSPDTFIHTENNLSQSPSMRVRSARKAAKIIPTLPIPVHNFLMVPTEEAVSVGLLRNALVATQSHENPSSLVHLVLSICVADDFDNRAGLRVAQFLGAAGESGDERIMEALCSPVSVSRIVHALKAFSKHPVITTGVLYVLTIILRQPYASCATFVETAGIESAVWALEEFRSIRPVVTHASTVLRLISKYDDEKNKLERRGKKFTKYITFAHEDGKPFDIDTFKTEAVDGDHLVDYEKTVDSTYSGTTVQVRCARVGALSALEGALARWSHAPRVQAIVISAVTAIVRGSRTAQWVACRGHIVAPILAAMKASPHELFLQTLCARAVTALCGSEMGNRIRVFDAGFLEHVFSILHLFREDAALVMGVFCGLSAALKLHPAMQSEFCKSGALEATLCTAGLHTDNASVLAAIATTLSHGLRVSISRKVFLHLGGIDFLVNTLAQGITRADVVVPVMWALIQSVRHSRDDPNRKEEDKTDAGWGLSLSNKADPSENAGRTVDFEKESCEAEKPNLGQFISIGGVHVVMDTMQRHVEIQEVQYLGTRLLRLAASSDLLPPSIGDAVVDSTIIAVSGHFRHAGIQENGCALLFQLTREDKTYQRIKCSGLVDMLDLTRAYHTDTCQVQVYAQALIEALSEPRET